MAERRSHRVELLALLLVIALCVLLSALSRKAGSDDNHTDPARLVRSSYYTYPEGYKALYLTLQELGYPVSRQSRPYALLPAQGTLIIADPYRVSISTYDSQQLFAWISQGNTALLLVEQQPELLTAFAGAQPAATKEGGHGADDQPHMPSDWEQKFAVNPPSSGGWLQQLDGGGAAPPVAPTSASPLAAAAGQTGDLLVNSACRFPRQALLPPELLAHVSDTQPLYADAAGVVAVSARIGAGKLICCSSPWSFSNQGLSAAPGNLDLLLALLDARPEQPILFDEYHHGYGAAMSLVSLAPAATRWGLTQLALVGVLLLVLAAWRLGPIRLPASARYTRSRAEYLTSMAGLLQRAGATGMVRTRLELLLKRELGRRLGLTVAADAAQLLAANAAHRVVDQALLSAVLQRLAAMHSQQRPDQTALMQVAAEVHNLLYQQR